MTPSEKRDRFVQSVIGERHQATIHPGTTATDLLAQAVLSPPAFELKTPAGTTLPAATFLFDRVDDGDLLVIAANPSFRPAERGDR